MNDIKIKDYNYELPDCKIAKYPLEQRDKSKLLIYKHGIISENEFRNLPEYLPKGALMIMNNTKVIQARLRFYKLTGAQIEIFLLEPALPSNYEQIFLCKGCCSWYCMIGNLKKWKNEILKKNIIVNNQTIVISASKLELHGTSYRVEFKWDNSSISFAEILDAIGELPIPPYLNRETQESDKTSYQTVYSKIKGSVAAPTAGLHFTQNVLQTLDSYGIEREEITLHVGAGTFKPVKSESISEHEMHVEYICVKKDILEKLLKHGCKAIAIGTTSVRTLESLYYMGIKVINNPDIHEEELHVGQWEPNTINCDVSVNDSIKALIKWLDRNSLSSLHSSTKIIIVPGYNFKIVNMLVTNFHQPQSTLLLLVSAFVNGEWYNIYDYALTHQFRFLSYGDSSLLIP